MTPQTLWNTLPRPIIGLAPMSGISDHPFRHIQKKYGNPALVYTEFTAVERLAVGDRDLLDAFLYDESQRPIIGQIYGHAPELFRRMAILLCELGFDGVDINMGCPSPSVVHRGSGAGLIRTPETARAIVAAVKQGVRDWQNGITLRETPGVPAHLVIAVEARRTRLPAAYRERRPIPVSLKTRVGYETPDVRAWMDEILQSEPSAIALHGRTLRQGYAGSADWEKIAEAVDFARGSGVVMLGNGDVKSLADAEKRIAETGVDGVLIGRGSYGNPFAFQPGDAEAVLAEHRYRMLDIALEHARLYEQFIGGAHRHRFMPMRKHLSWYARSIPSAAHLRRELIQTESADQVAEILARYHANRHWLQHGEQHTAEQTLREHTAKTLHLPILDG
jgi:nifR3 family TIM-barrel protein